MAAPSRRVDSKDTRQPLRGILKNSPSHQPRACSPGYHVRHHDSVATASSSSLASTRSRMFIGQRTVSDCGHSAEHPAQSRSRRRWVRALLSTFSTRRPSRSSELKADTPVRPAARNVQRRSATPVGSTPPSSYRDPMSASQISLPTALPRRKRALSDVGQAPPVSWRPSSPPSGRVLYSPQPMTRVGSPTLAVTRSRRLGSFDFER